MDNLTQRITEASLSRILHHTEEGQWAILTSWRDELTPEQNKSNFIEFKQAIRSLNLGFIPLRGKWRDEATGEIVSEPSVFVIGMKPQDAHRIGNKYNQDAVLVGSPGEVQLIFKSGGKEKIGSKFSAKDANNIFSEWKGRKFVFESLELIANSFAGALTEKLTGLPVDVVDDALSRVSEGEDVDAILAQLRGGRS